MSKWFANKANGSDLKNTVAIPSAPIGSTSKPRAVTALNLFAKENALDIRERMATKRMAEGTTPQESNLNYHREIKSQMFNDSDEATKAKYEAEAAALNEKRKLAPEPHEIYKYVSLLYCSFAVSHWFPRNQQDILATASATLRSLCGWDWGQHGDVALFLVGAFRDEKQKLKLFKYVILVIFISAAFLMPRTVSRLPTIQMFQTSHLHCPTSRRK